MGIDPELLAELAAALKQAGQAKEVLLSRRFEMGVARAALANARTKVEEIEAEIRSQFETGQSTRPLLAAIAAKATFADPDPEPRSKPRRKQTPVGATP